MRRAISHYRRFICCTLFASQIEYPLVHVEAKRSLNFLCENQFLIWRQDKQEFEPTKLGKCRLPPSSYDFR